MYNRILKRPMFKRGGSSHQAQGTGITSPFDTPRKHYEAGARGKWAKQVRELTQDPRGDLSYGVEGFSALANPYKESGEAKMLSEMLWEGAGGVRASREKGRELEQKGEMAILESDLQKIMTDEDRAWKKAQTEEERAWKEAQTAKQQAHELQLKKDTYMDQHPGKTYRGNVQKWNNWTKNYQGQAGYETVSKNIEAFAQADMIVTNQLIDDYRAGKTSLAQAVPPQAFKNDGTIDISILTGSVVYYDPISKSWFTVKNPGTENATVIPADSYIEGWHNLDQNPPSDKDILEKQQEINKKVEEKQQKSATELAEPYTKEDWEESAKEGTQKILDRFKFQGDITEGQSNRYIQNNKDTQLGKLQNWWQNTIVNDKG